MKKLSGWLEELDGHEAYKVDWVRKHIKELGDGRDVALSTFSAGRMRSEVGQHPKGPVWVDDKLDDHELLIAGFDLARAIAIAYLGKDPAGFITGRGSGFRFRVRALAEAGY